MYSFTGKSYDYCTINNIRKLVNDLQIYSFYMGESVELFKKYKNPLRKDDNPSFVLMGNEKYVNYWDYSLKEKPASIISFVGNMFNITDYKDICTKINIDLDLNLFNLSDKKFKKFKGTIRDVVYKSKENKIITCQIQKFTKRDKIYWNSYGISLDTLKHFNVFSTNTVRLNGNIIAYYENYNPIYTYVLSDTSKKIYLPFNKNYRFFNSGPTLIQGYSQLPKTGEVLIITKSMKDLMFLYELGYSAIAPNSETTGIDINIINELKSRFKKVILFYDYDETGIDVSNFVKNIYNIPIMFTEEKDAKDITDYFKKYKSKEKCISLIKSHLC